MDIRISLTTKQTTKLWLVPHDRMRYDYDNELGGGWRFNPKINGLARKSAREYHAALPEVYRLEPEDGFKLPISYQNLLAQINPLHSYTKAMTLLNAGLAFCNGEWGRFDQMRVMGGWVVTGEIVGDNLWIETLKVDEPAPTADYVLSRPYLWGWCVSVKPDGGINLWTRKALDGAMKPVKMFVISQADTYIPLDELYPLSEGAIPSPTWMPNPV